MADQHPSHLLVTPRAASEDHVTRVSIVIPTLGNPLILQCLDSLRRTLGPTLPYEVVVVANGAPTSQMEPVRQAAWPGVRLVTTPVNQGFVGGCNRGAAAATGEFLVFLNDDTEVLPGWLDALVDTADSHPEAGAVGSMILFADGTIQEAGSIVWRDGSTLGVARGLSVDANPYNYLRPVDYCSACSLLVRREAFEQVGGFDIRYFPAYYEDADLCFALARTGLRTLLQPRSRLVHHESVSSSTPRKTYLVLRNRAAFRQKWAGELDRLEVASPTNPHAVACAVERARSNQHLLIIDDRPPQRGCGSGFNVLLDAIEDIEDTGCAVTLAISDRLDGDLALLADLGVHVRRDRPEAVLAELSGQFDRVLISRPHNFTRYASLVRQHQPQASLMYLAEALFYRRMQRTLELATDPRERESLTAEMLESRRLERAIPRQADGVVCVSDEEAAILSTVEGHCPIHTIRPVEPGLAPTAAGFPARSGLLFTPGWLAGDASPNVDALHWFVTEVLPRLLEARPGIRLRVTGANPPPAARALAGPAVELIGFVPDLRALYESARVVVVPMRVGSGVKVKCLEALQHGVPVVSTAVGAEGLALSDPRAVIVADGADAFARAVIELTESQDAWERQRAHVLRVAARWRSQPERTWRDLLTPEESSPHDETQSFGT